MESRADDPGTSTGGLPTNDPFNWTTEETIQFLCFDPLDNYPQIRNALQSIRQKVDLAPIFRDQDISGYVLLNDLTDEVLRYDFGIGSFGIRREIIRVAKVLRQCSELCQLDRVEAAQQPYLSRSNTDGQYPKSPALQKWLTDGSRFGSPSDSFRTPPALFKHPPSLIARETGATEELQSVPIIRSHTGPDRRATPNHDDHHFSPSVGLHTPTVNLPLPAFDSKLKPVNRTAEQLVLAPSGTFRRKLVLKSQMDRDQSPHGGNRVHQGKRSLYSIIRA